MVFENGVKNIQAAAYNGARTVDKSSQMKISGEYLEVQVHIFKSSPLILHK